MARRRNTSGYQVVRQEGVELLVSPNLAKHSRQLSVELKEFWFFRHLKAEAELTNGLVLGRRVG